ncbi:hypothetical protein CTI12_AA352320 [Artemisia annua]|uniref:Serine hydroxymethyltransferase-like domain-containing protein n=1 Tax=Artemisia annua TaxID=35608 RepID=A0A2U1MQ03_ARTAN|nr:hypothetical protein CTI12_AA352320 [Artemisia annua]
MSNHKNQIRTIFQFHQNNKMESIDRWICVNNHRSICVNNRSKVLRDSTRILNEFHGREEVLYWPKQLNAPLEVVDPEIADVIGHEKACQWKGLELIPSKNFTSVSVMQAVGSVMTNKHSEGIPVLDTMVEMNSLSFNDQSKPRCKYFLPVGVLTWQKRCVRSVPWNPFLWIQQNGEVKYLQLPWMVNIWLFLDLGMVFSEICVVTNLCFWFCSQDMVGVTGFMRMYAILLFITSFFTVQNGL